MTVSPAVLKRARGVYNDRCAVGHGDKGNGKGEGAEPLGVRPADFTDARVMFETTDSELF